MSFGRKRGEVLRISHHSPQWRDILDQESLMFRCDEPLDLSLRYEGCKIYDMAHGQNKTMSFLHMVLIAALECLPESSDDA